MNKKRIRCDLVTIFPGIFDSYFRESIIARAIKKKLIVFRAWNVRDFAEGKDKKARATKRHWSFGRVDEKPYGGGAGMVLMAEPILRATARILRAQKGKKQKTKIVVFSAKGKQFTQEMAYRWAKRYTHFVFIAGRYEGIDERVVQALEAEEISIGPYVLTDGDVAAMAVASSLVRLIPGAIRLESLQEESHKNKILQEEKGVAPGTGLEYPHYTRPEVLRVGKKKFAVPKVLLSGNHKKIQAWRKQHSRPA